MHPTDEITVTLSRPKGKPVVFTVSGTLGRKVESLIKKEARTEKSVPASTVFPVLADDARRPAAALRGSRYKENMTQIELAKLLGIRQGHLSEMENGKRPIGKSMAKKLASIFNCDYRAFL